MSQPSFPNHNDASALADSEVIRLVSEKLPRFRAACDDSEADMVILQQRAFGTSPDELFLMSLAIKYAGIAKKNVTIVA